MSDTAIFLAHLCEGLADDECQEIRTFHRGGPKDGKPGPRDFIADGADGAAIVAALPGGLDVYYAVNPRRRGAGGKKAAVSTIRRLHADMDDKHFPDGRAGVVAALAAFPLPPTWVIVSGGGVQALWELADPIRLLAPDGERLPDADARTIEAESIMQRLYAALGGMDSVQDISRVLRVPGTLNAKYTPARPVAIRHHDPDARYSLADFLALLPAPAPAPRPSAPRHTFTSDDPTVEEVRELLRHIPPHGDYKDHWITVLAAVHKVLPGADGAALCEEWSPGKPGEIKRKFASFGNYRGPRGMAGAGTLYHLARQGGWRPARPAIPATPPAPAVDASALVAQLRAENAALRERVGELDGELVEERRLRARAQKTLTSVIQIRRNPHVKAERETIAAAVFDLSAEIADGRADPDGWAKQHTMRIAEATGKSVDTVRKHLERAEAWGLFERKLVEEPDPVTGERRTPYYYRAKVKPDEPEIILDVLVTLEPQREEGKTWGGRREPCPKCGGTKRRTVVSCGDCGLVFGERVTDIVPDVPPTVVEVAPARHIPLASAPVYEEVEDTDPLPLVEACWHPGCTAIVRPSKRRDRKPQYCDLHDPNNVTPHAAPVSVVEAPPEPVPTCPTFFESAPDSWDVVPLADDRGPAECYRCRAPMFARPGAPLLCSHCNDARTLAGLLGGYVDAAGGG